MSILQRASQVVADAEAALRRMIGEAAESGDYTSVEALARWASALGEMCLKERHSASAATEISVQLTPSKSAAPTTPLKSRSAKVTGKRRSYPYFAKSGETLVKVAWSKSSKSEYQHKSPRTVAMKLADALAQQGKNGAVVAMEKVLPLKLDDGAEVPDYQVYVSLAWLRQIGVAKQNGRQGYTIKKPSELGKLVEASWSELAEAKPS